MSTQQIITNAVGTLKSNNARKPTEDSDVVKLLRARLKTGIRKRDVTANAVWVGHPKFQ